MHIITANYCDRRRDMVFPGKNPGVVITAAHDPLEKKGRLLASAALAFIAFTLASVILTWPLATGMNKYYFSPEAPGDGAGLIALDWYHGHTPEAYRDGDTTTFYAYPLGASVVRPGGYQFSTVRRALAGVIGAQASYNLAMLLSYPLAGIAFFFLVFYVTRSPAASAVSGFLYAFSPWHVSRTFDQLSLASVFTLPLFLLALIAFWRRRDMRTAAGLSAASLAAVYADLHFGIFCAFIAVAWAVAAAVSSRRAPSSVPSSAGRPRKTLALSLAMIAVIALASIPAVQAALYRDPLAFEGAPDRGSKGAADFSSDPWNYVVPPAHTLVWGGLTDGFVGPRLGARTTNEVTAYPGLVTYGLAAAAVAFALAARRRDLAGVCPRAEPGSSPAEDRTALSRAVFLFCLLGAAGAFILSLPPHYRVGGTRIYTPSAVLEATVPIFRYYCRWALVVTFSLCLLAAIGLAQVQKRWRARPRAFALLSVALMALFVLDVTIVPPSRSTPFSRPPETLAALARHPASEPVAIYPLAQGHELATLHYMYYQRFHRHPMLNGTKPATEADLYRLSLKDVYSPYTPRMLAGLGVRKVAVLAGYFANREYGNYPYGVEFDPAMMPPGYRLMEKTGDGYIYDVIAEPASLYPLYYSGFTPPGIMSDGRSWSAVTSDRARMELVNRGGDCRYAASVTIANPGGTGTLSVELDGEELGRLQLQPGVRRLALPDALLKAGNHQLVFKWTGVPVEMEGTAFRAGGGLKVRLLVSDPRFEERRDQASRPAGEAISRAG